MEFMPEFTVKRPESIADAVAAYAEAGNPRYLAGGTDMVVNIRRGIEVPDTLVDLTMVAEMKEIREDADGLHIGAAVTLRELSEHPVAREKYTALAEAAGQVAGATHQQYGTVGGNLCLDTRCLFYNQSEWWRKSNDYCLKHRGDTCHVAPGGKRCFAAFSGDVAPAALVLGGEVEVVGPDGQRRMPLADMYRNDGMNHLTLGKGELVTALHIPAASAALASSYTKSRVRGSIDFPLAGAAVALRMDGDTLAELRIALTAVNPYPQIVKGTEDFVGQPLTAEALQTLQEKVQTQAKPMKTTTIEPWYRRRVVGALAKRLTETLAKG